MPEELVVLELPTTHGSRAVIFDYPREGVALLEVEKGEPEDRHGRWSGKAFAVRTAVGTAADGIYARFGQIGTASGEIKVSGRGLGKHGAGPANDCQGRQPRYLHASFSGTIALRVKNGFLRINTSEANGYAYRGNELGCEKGKGRRTPRDWSDPFSYLPHPVQSFRGRESPILFSSLHHRHRWIEMAASLEATTAGLASFRAEAMEWLPEHVATVRWAEASRVSPQFLAFGTGGPPRSATLDPPEPFSGSARFIRRSHSLRGSLAVRLPGGPHVRLGSKSSHAYVCDLNLRRACR